MYHKQETMYNKLNQDETGQHTFSINDTDTFSCISTDFRFTFKRISAVVLFVVSVVVKVLSVVSVFSVVV